MNTNLSTQPDDVITSVRLSREQHEALKDLAAREHRSVSGQLRVILDAHLGRAAEEPAA